MSNQTTDTDTTQTIIRIFRAVVVLAVGISLGFLVWQNATKENATHPFKLGLDLAGGSHLVYEADVSGIAATEVPELMETLRTVIENRINVFGVSEPIVQVEQSSFVTDEVRHRLVVELPGVTDVETAVAEIGKTPLLEFKLIDQAALSAWQSVQALQNSATGSIEVGGIKVNGEEVNIYDAYVDTGLTGRYLESAALEFTGSQGGQLANEPIVSIRFTAEGAKLFEEITRANIGENLAIFLDGEEISAPRINEPISGGTAVISGGFNPEEARALAQNLNFGALPVPIVLESTQTVGASLGADVLEKGMTAGFVGLALVAVFMVLYYRLPGIVAVLALLLYIVIMLALFQYIPVTLTAAGLAGFILSLGMAVDANVLVFERMKEEIKKGNSTRNAARVGFARAWSAIRDGNVTSLISAIILFWFGTSVVKGFALVFGVGVIISMFSALVLTRTLLLALPDVANETGWVSKLFRSGFSRK